MPDAFETSLKQTDEIADRLRREAERVTRRAALEADRETARQAQRACRDALEALADDEAALDRGWRALWREVGVEHAVSPAEMRPWLAELVRSFQRS